ncbi:endochitinase A-like [Haliotis rubra]|uniref:endochitinase A-like n=1 Tax=Haliotis rubra TaxID=36100 RepID=UPI001EE58B8E|nr:endochitinase A-like [Haliotis rubra]
MKRLFLLHLLTFAWIHLTSPRTVPSSFTMDEDDLYEKLTARRAPVIYPPLLLDHIRADETDTESIVTSLSQTSQLSQNYFTNRVNSVMLYTSTSSSVMSSLPPSSSSGLLVTTSSKVMLDTTALTTSSSINEDVIRCVPIAAHLEKWSSTGTASGTWLPITPTRTIHDTIAASQPEPRPTSATSSASPPGQTAVPSMSESLTVMVDGLPQTPQPSRTETSTASVQSRMHGSKTIPESKPEPESHPRPASATSSASAPGHTAVSSMSQPVTVMADGLPQTPQTSRTERSTASVQSRMHGSKTIPESKPEPESHPRPASATSSASAPGHTAVSSMSQPVTVMADGLPQTPQTSRTERSTASVQPRMHGSSTIRASTPMQSHLSQSTSDRNTSVVFILPTANRNIQEVTTNSDSRYGSTFLSLDTHPTTEPSLRSSVLLLPSNIYIQTSYALDGQYITVNTLSLQSASTTFNTAPSISISTSNALDQSSPVLSPDYVVVSSAFVHQFEPSHVTPSSVVAVPAVTQHFDIAADQNLGLHINRETDVTRLPQVLDPLLGVNAALNELSGVRQNKTQRAQGINLCCRFFPKRLRP